MMATDAVWLRLPKPPRYLLAVTKPLVFLNWTYGSRTYVATSPKPVLFNSFTEEYKYRKNTDEIILLTILFNKKKDGSFLLSSFYGNRVELRHRFGLRTVRSAPVRRLLVDQVGTYCATTEVARELIARRTRRLRGLNALTLQMLNKFHDHFPIQSFTHKTVYA